MKRVVWLGDRLSRLREFPADVMHEIGYQLERVQAGREPADWKPVPPVGLGVSEIRVRLHGAFRLLYMAKFPEAVYVLHAFRKKSEQMARADVELARRRFAQLVNERRRQ